MKNSKLFQFSFVLLVGLLISTAGTTQRKIVGIVQDATTNLPLGGATITLKSSKRKMVTIFQKADYSLKEKPPVAILPAVPLNIITGTVKDQLGNPLAGVSIIIKGTGKGTSTKADGSFSIEANAGDVLEFSIVGYQNKNVTVGQSSTLIVVMEIEAVIGTEVVVVGYGTQKKSDLSSAVATVDVNQVQKNTVLPNVANGLEGTTAGVSVSTSSGAPGSPVNIHIRGVNTFGDTRPLVIIDGVPGDLNILNPNDIQSISILKDAASAAIYGSRAANGVILVTTKNGKPGKTNISIQASYGTQSPVKFLPLLNGMQWAKITNALHLSAGTPIYPELSNPDSFGEGTNWQKALYRSAPILNSYIGISGGNNNSTYHVSGAYVKQDGISLDTWSEKGNVHFNGHQNAGAFKFNENLSVTKVGTRSQANSGLNPIFYTLYAQPIFPIHDTSNLGGYAGTPNYISNQTDNPVGDAVMFKNLDDDLVVNVGINASFNFLKYFSYKLNTGYDITDAYSSNYTPTYYYNNTNQGVRSFLNENRSRRIHWLVENTLNYEERIGRNNLTALIGYTFEEDRSRNTGGSMEGFPNNNLQVLSAGTGYGINAYGNAYRWDLQSILGRIDYSFGNKYFATVNFRRDGSSRFGAGKRYGFFPSASVAWRISDENFFQSLRDKVQNLKLRASYGLLGNQPSNNYGSIPTVTYSPSLGYLIGGTMVTGAAIQEFANPDIAWETTRDLNIGVDIDFLRSFTVTSDYYLDRTDNLLLAVPIPPSSGASDAPPIVNTGKVQNNGFELSLTYHSNKNKELDYAITGNFSTERNKVVMLGYAGQVIFGTPARRSVPVTEAKVGYPIGAFFAMQADGLFRNQKEVDNWKNDNGEPLQPNAQPGDVRYIDVNGDGTVSTDDIEPNGSPFPKFSYGINFTANYKNFDFTLFIQGTQGNKMFDSNTWLMYQTTNEFNHSAALLDAWSADNPNGKFPRLTLNDPNQNGLPSSRFIFDASYLRLKTLQLGYTLPFKGDMHKVGILKMRVFIGAYNLFTLTKYPGYDPSYTGDGLIDRGLDAVRYPLYRIINGGININF